MHVATGAAAGAAAGSRTKAALLGLVLHAAGFFQVSVDAGKGARFRFQSPRDKAYSLTLTVS